jgi:hypothetical protein
MDNATVKRKWANWKFGIFLLILIAVFVKFFVLDDHDENAPVTVEMDLPQVAFRNEQEVDAILGPGKVVSYYRDDRLNCEKCPTKTYREGKIEITFINEIADRITLRNLNDFDFDDRVILGLLNLKENIAPKIDHDEIKRWDNYEKYTQIAAFSSGDKIEYILIKAKSE